MYFCPLDEPPVGTGQPRGLGLAHGVQGVAEVTQDVELVEQDARLRRMALRGSAKRFPPYRKAKIQRTSGLGTPASGWGA